jgi:hypothetical protein
VFIIPPQNVRVEVGHQLVWRRESIKRLHTIEMTVIAFTAFVIISQHTFAVDYVSETIFVRMLRWQNWLGNTPDRDFCECVWD